LISAAVFGKSFTEGYEEDGEISAIYLREDYIGRGYGHRLYVDVEQVLAAKGYANYVLDVLSENQQAIQFYLSQCFNRQFVAVHSDIHRFCTNNSRKAEKNNHGEL
jgi:ribosomal protein S18 acetylase RimI-like enzyme